MATLAALVLALGGCATARRPVSAPGLAIEPSAAALGPLPADALGTQRLYRGEYDGPEGRAAMRLVLRLETAESYDLAASDGLGRPVWRLEVRAGHGLLLDLAAERFCRVETAAALPGGLGLGLGLDALPRTLLGLLPVVANPVGAAHEWRDGAARRWTWMASTAGLDEWTLWSGEEPAVWWSRRGARATLSIRRRATQLRWQQSVVEALGGALAPARVPDGFGEGQCDVGDLP